MTPPSVVPRLVVRMLDSSARPEAGAAWLALEQRLGGAPALSCSWDWTALWLDHFGAAVPHRFALAERPATAAAAAGAGTERSVPAVVAIALVTQAPARPPRPRAWHLGTAGEPPGASVFVERNRLLAEPEIREAFAAALLAQLDGASGWDRLRLDGLHHEDAQDLLAALPGGAAPAVRSTDAAHVTATVEQSPVADLQAGEDVLAGLSGSRRQRIRRSLRAFGELEVDWAQDAAQADAILTELIDLHQRRWQEAGEPGAFVDPRYVAFHRALVAAFVPLGRAAVVRVRRGAETVGCLYGLIDGDRLCFYQGGLQRYEDNKLRAGVAAHVSFMQACRERGLAAYDFLAPAVRYKEELAGGAEQLTWIEVVRPGGWRMRLSDATRSLRARR